MCSRSTIKTELEVALGAQGPTSINYATILREVALMFGVKPSKISLLRKLQKPHVKYRGITLKVLAWSVQDLM